jgi:hypothetical protein
MDLAKDQLKGLRRILVDLFDLDDLHRIVAGLGYDVDHYSPGGPRDLVVSALLNGANAEGWIVRLIDELAARYPTHGDLQALSASLPRSDESSAVDPLGACYIDNRPFVNRGQLRATLRSILTDHGPRILIVRGERRSGKTYTVHLIKHLSQHLGFEVVHINLVPYAAVRDISAVDIGRAIAAQLGLAGVPEIGNEQMSRWTLSYFNWLTGQLRARAAQARPWWVVVDGFESVSVPMAVQDFIDELAVRIDDTLRNVRAVLIGYDWRLPFALDPTVAIDTTSAITVEDLSAFFLQFYLEQRPHLDAAERMNRAAEHVREVLERVGPEGQTDAIGREVTAQCRKILAEAS